MAYPVTYLVAAALLYDIPASSCLSILLSPGFQLLSLVSVIAGYGLWEMLRWSWYLFLVSLVASAYFAAILALDYGESHHRALAYFLSILGLVALAIRVSRELKVPYFLPSIRWWESNPRYKLSAQANLSRTEGNETVPGEILDLSLGGCFVKLRSNLKLNESVRVDFTLFGQAVQAEGLVVWTTESAVTHPKGVGIKFSSLPKPQRKLLKAMTRRLKQISRLYRRSRYLMSQEEFSARIEELRTTPLKLEAP